MKRREKVHCDTYLPIKLITFHTKSSHVLAHTHPELELILPLQSTSILVMEGQKRVLEPHHLYIINSNVEHELCQTRDDIYKGYCLQISSHFLAECLHDYNAIYFKQPEGEMNQLLVECFLRIVRLYAEDHDYKQFEIRYEVNQLLYLICTHLLVDQDNHSSIIIDQVIDYIMAHYDEDLCTSSICSYYHVSRSYLSTRFKKETGITMKGFLDNIRMIHAAEDLLYSDRSIVDIAYQNGYQAIKTFNTQFKLKFGITPKEYKNKMTML